MKRKFIILRASPRNTRDVFGGVSSFFQPQDFGSASVSVEEVELDNSGVAHVLRDPSVIVVPPAMPMKLVEPVDIHGAAPAVAGTSWGIQAVGADTSPFSGRGVKVAVLDTGIDAAHPAFAGVNLIQRNFTSGNATDEVGHGTHCAGTIVGRDFNGQRIGVARGVTDLIIGKVLRPGEGSSAKILEAMTWAASIGANVISMSLGLDFPGYVASLQAQGMSVQAATSMGLEGYRLNVLAFERLASFLRAQSNFLQPLIIVAAAGNESRRDLIPPYEISVSPPAVSEGICSVAALMQTPQGAAVASFSNTGANISGPGVDITSSWPGGGLRSMSGTSMATPHIAGVAALWAEKINLTRPLTTTEWVARLLASGSIQSLAPGIDPLAIGSGIAHAPQA